VDEYGLKEFIVQEYLTGTEYSVGMIGNPETGFHFLPILQVDYCKVVKNYGLQPILGWESKWDPDSPYWSEVDYIVSPRIPSSQKDTLNMSERKSNKKMDFVHNQEEEESESTLRARGYLSGGLTLEEERDLKSWCVKLFERFGLRDYARFDWRADREVLFHPSSGDRRRAGRFDDTEDEIARFSSGLRDFESLTEIHRDLLTADDGLSETTSVSSHHTSLSDSGRGSLPSGGRSRSSDDGGAVATDRGSIPTVASRPMKIEGCLRELKLLEVNPNPGW
jgi:hypothetical protein